MKKILQLCILAALSATILVMSSCTTSSKPAPRPSKPTPTQARLNPKVIIHNNSYKTIVVGVRGPEQKFVTVPARSRRSVYLRPGTYKYAAAARNIPALTGYKTFSANKVYNWTFSKR